MSGAPKEPPPLRADLERMGPIPAEEQSAAQRAAWAAVVASRGAIGGPFIPLLRSPELLNRFSTWVRMCATRAVCRRA